MAASKGINFSYFKLSDKIFHLGVLMELAGGEHSVTASIFDS